VDPADLRALLDELRGLGNDTARVEAKKARGGLPGKLWETISAFANSGGGVLLFGVDEGNDFAPVGVTDAASLETSLASMLSDRMDPPVRAVIETQLLDGRSIVVAEIPALPRALQPCFYRGEGPYRGSYVRVADGDRRLSEYEVGLLLAGRGQPREDERPVEQANPKDLSDDLVGAYVARLRQRRPRAFGDMAQQDVLHQTKVLVRTEGGRVVPSLAGLLSLGTFPQTHLPQVDLSLVVYPTAESGQPGPRGERFLDNVTFDGAIPDIVEDVLERLRLRMSRRSVVAGAGRRDVWEYPELALREAVANALVHRDLSPGALGAQVQIEMYPDRLVVRSPGGLYGPVEIDRLGQGGVSSARNALLLKLLEDVPNRTGGTVVENRGSGIPAMVQSLRAAGMAGPTFRDEISFFEVVFPNAALLDDETVQWLTGLGVTGLTDSQLLALARMRRGEVLRNASYRSELGVDSRRATTELRDLVDRGLVDVEGTRGGATYQLPSAQPVRPTQLPPDVDDVVWSALDEPRTRRELQDLTHLPQHTVLQRLRKLRADGLVEQTGPARAPNVRWRRVGQAPAGT
jgi:ATP-dependent DNA helicase RecG